MLILNLLVVFIFGLIVGSFISAYTYRFPRNISVLKGRSFCPHCKNSIKWYDNIPLLSFLFLKGRCRNCRYNISLRYPLIELSTAIIFSLAFLVIENCRFVVFPVFTFGPICSFYDIYKVLAIPFLLTILGGLIAIFIIDFDNQIIPDQLVFNLMAITLLFLLLFSPQEIYLKLTSGFFVALFFLSLNLITKGKGMGLGDVKFVLFGGLLLGWPEVISWLFLSFVVGGLVGVVLIFLGKAKLGKQIPFGPFLIIGLVAILILGDILNIGLYLR